MGYVDFGSAAKEGKRPISHQDSDVVVLEVFAIIVLLNPGKYEIENVRVLGPQVLEALNIHLYSSNLIVAAAHVYATFLSVLRGEIKYQRR
ncbi:hypothetical protein D3C85_1277620 [compost metagenome]